MTVFITLALLWPDEVQKMAMHILDDHATIPQTGYRWLRPIYSRISVVVCKEAKPLILPSLSYTV